MNFDSFQDTSLPIQIVSFDAGGIYGLCTAIMLRKLCERDENFLNGEAEFSKNHIDLFAGTSAGSVISLLLAKEKSPRDVVLRGEVEQFFKEPGVYGNYDPLSFFPSLFGLSSWSGREDFLCVLRKYFGEDLRLGDLKHRVMITTFDYTGNPEVPAEERKWKPKIFYNFPDSETDRNTKVIDVAYGACSLPGLRPICDGLTDGGVFSPCPNVDAIAKVISQNREEKLLGDLFRQTINVLIEILVIHKNNDDEERVFPLYCEGIGDQINKLKAIQDKLRGLGKPLPESFLLLLQKCTSDAPNDEELSKNLYLTEVNFSFLAFGILTLYGSKSPQYKEIEEKTKKLEEKLKKIFDLFEPTPEPVQKVVKKEPDPGEPTPTEPTPTEPDLKCKFIVQVYFEALEVFFLHLKEVSQPTSMLDNISMLSLGVCRKEPFYWLDNFNLGYLGFLSIPENPCMDNWYNPFTNILLGAPTAEAIYVSRQLLDYERFFRLNPPVVDFPTPPILPSVYMARFKLLRDWILYNLEESMTDEIVEQQITEALEFLHGPGWSMERN